jgi:small-conductance mechanosensitive channel
MGIVMHLIALVAYAAVFRTDVGHLLISLSSISVASAFVFGNSMKTIYESVIFLFVIRPYQVGDAIFYKGCLHTVKNFGLLSTQFSRYDGCRIWVRPPSVSSCGSVAVSMLRIHLLPVWLALRWDTVLMWTLDALSTSKRERRHDRVNGDVQVPNETLMAADIVNVSQSKPLQDRLLFEVDAGEITPPLCEELATEVLEMMKREEPRRLFNTDFYPFCYISGLSNPLKYQVCLWGHSRICSPLPSPFPGIHQLWWHAGWTRIHAGVQWREICSSRRSPHTSKSRDRAVAEEAKGQALHVSAAPVQFSASRRPGRV